ncbi:MAG: outer membrane protein assembly factor BamD [Candidatus Midichloria sp.]|nr:MAG: outer membrane protein assembly factor BamD [Candidatus Midichloria sp.]
MKWFESEIHGAIFFFILVVQGCSYHDEQIIVTNPNALYEESLVLIQKENFEQAIKNFEVIDRDFPASESAVKSSMMKSYAFYLKGELIDAIFAAEDFIKKYPVHPNVDYMYYMKALCEYDQIVDVERDQKQTLKAKEALEELILKYPHSKYLEDAKQKRLYTYNVIAGKEMAIAALYRNKGKLIPALIRYRSVVKDYNDTIFIEEALYRMTEIYYKMGIKKEAKMYAAVLSYNYPSSPWYRKAYNLIQETK